MADACVFIMENRDFKTLVPLSGVEGSPENEIRNTHINIGSGKEISIKELAETIKNIIGYKGVLVFNSDKPDGTMRKLTDVSKLNSLGWKHTIELEEGIKKVYDWYVKRQFKDCG
jgi:GDP-L-fucose synthase